MKRVSALSDEKQTEAAALYLSGLSAQQVADRLSVSLDATFYALRRKKIARRTSVQSNKLRYDAAPLSFKLALKLSPSQEQLKLAAVMLYWAEGYKVGKNKIDFANSDPAMACIFRRFLTEICGVDERRIRCCLYVYQGQDVEELTHFWSNALQIPKEQFTKPYVKTSNPGVRGPRMNRGLVHIRYCDTKLLRQLLIWIDEYAAKCVGGGVVNRTTL